jgi:cellulose synthase/poly-beta-1,6-N-acetylglucosamine synthase-like glycosyltransferase
MHRERVQPLVSVIVPAHNEERNIATKLQNILMLAYPRECLEILVGSDGSTDRTEQIAREFTSERLRLIVHPAQRGKSTIQNELINLSSGSILVFTDADCVLDRDSLQNAVDNFADPEVGLVTGKPLYSNPGETHITQNESVYLRYESWIRQQESDRGLLSAATGSFFAVRRSLWRPLTSNVGDDFVLPIQVAIQGSQNVFEPGAIVCTQLTQNDVGSMLRLKRRIVSKDLHGLWENRESLNPLCTGRFAIAIWSHKLLRWLVPFFLILMLVSNAVLASHPLYSAFLSLQVVFYLLAALGFFVTTSAARRCCSVPLSFCIVNMAAFLGVLECARGRTSGAWRPVR